MRKYEIMFIVRPDLEEANIKTIADNMKTTLESNSAKVVDVKEMGQRDLAYEINKHKKGYYFLYVVNTTAEVIKEFNRLANVNENIIRHLIIKVEK